MIIDSLTDKRDIDISTLAVIEPKRRQEMTFDPKTDLLPSDFEEAYLRLGSKRTGVREGLTEISTWTSYVRPLLFLFADKRDELGVDRQMQQVLFKRINETRRGGRNQDGVAFIHAAADAKILYPDRVDELNLNQTVFQFVCDTIEESVGLARHPKELRRIMVDAVILFPQGREELLALDPALPVDIFETALDWNRNHGEWMDFASRVSAGRLLFPEMKGLKSSDWVGLRKRLKEVRVLRNSDFLLDFAFDLLVIAAEEARIGEEGLVINLRKKNSLETVEKIPAMPVRRSF